MERPDPGTAELTEPEGEPVAAPEPSPASSTPPVAEQPASAEHDHRQVSRDIATESAGSPPVITVEGLLAAGRAPTVDLRPEPTPSHEELPTAGAAAVPAHGTDAEVQVPEPDAEVPAPEPDAEVQAPEPDAEPPGAQPLATAHPGDVPPEAEPAAAEHPGRRRALLPALLGLLLLGLVAGIGWTVLDARAADRRDDARQAALQLARQQAVNLTTISHETADRDLGRIIAAATGTLKTQFESQRKTFPDVLRREKSVSTGRVLAAGVREQNGDTVDALVAVDATVRNTASGAAGVVKHYRMDMRLIRIDGRWLVSAVAFAGLPQ